MDNDRDYMSSEEKKKWASEWDFWRGYFQAVKKKNTDYILVPKDEQEVISNGKINS